MLDKTPAIGSIHRNILLATVNACMFVFGVILLLMGSLLPTLGVSGVRAGSLGSLPLIGILAATVLVGPLLDKVGAKPVLAAALALIVAALAVMPSLASFGALAAAALAYGFGGGTLNTATNALVSDLSATRRSAALNLLGFSFSLGAVTAPLLMSLAARNSSATVLRVLAVAAATVLVLVLALRFPEPAHSGTPLPKLLRVLTDPLVWLFGVLLFFESGNENCMFVWAGKLTGDRLHLATQRADLALVGLSAALGAGRLLAVVWLKRVSGRTLLLVSAAVTVAGAILVVALASFAGMVAGFAVIGMGMSAIFPTALGLAGDRFPDNTGTVFGGIMTVALVGGALGPAVGGWAASSSPSKVLLVPLICGVAIAVLTMSIASSIPLARREGPRP
ncbi:MAG: MFS transporter [Terriglobia bacterium]|jgi:fucose permease